MATAGDTWTSRSLSFIPRCAASQPPPAPSAQMRAQHESSGILVRRALWTATAQPSTTSPLRVGWPGPSQPPQLARAWLNWMRSAQARRWATASRSGRSAARPEKTSSGVRPPRAARGIRTSWSSTKGGDQHLQGSGCVEVVEIQPPVLQLRRCGRSQPTPDSTAQVREPHETGRVLLRVHCGPRALSRRPRRRHAGAKHRDDRR